MYNIFYACVWDVMCMLSNVVVICKVCCGEHTQHRAELQYFRPADTSFLSLFLVTKSAGSGRLLGSEI
jgi:hypothetical protein